MDKNKSQATNVSLNDRDRAIVRRILDNHKYMKGVAIAVRFALEDWNKRYENMNPDDKLEI